MKNEIEVLIKKYGHISTTAKKLGVTRRTIEKIRNGEKVSAPLEKLILLKVKLINIDEL